MTTEDAATTVDAATYIMYHGIGAPPTTPRTLRAGPLSLTLEGVDLRYIRLGECEVLRRVYVAVRDRNWDTIPPALSNMRLEDRADSFDLSFDARHTGSGIDFSWCGRVRGAADGALSYVMDGTANSSFWKCRIGFCILHPMACAGVPCTVEHVDGTGEEGVFPVHVSPHQPFLDFTAIAHDVAPGVRAEVRLAGDTFEMEDQRNWTDASYKTYSTPLRLPYPVEVRQGARIMQSFTLALCGTPSQAAGTTESMVTVAIDPAVTRPLPRIGLGMASHGRPLSDDEAAYLRALHIGHLRVDLDLGSPAYAASLQQAVRASHILGVPLEIALFLSNAAEGELAALTGELERARPDVAAWLIFHKDEKSTSARWVELARRALTMFQPGAVIGAGTNAYFAELNRGRPPIDVLDLVGYSLNPQVHAFDNASLTETLATQAVTLDSARAFCGDRPLAVGPVTLKPRFNPNATGPEPESGPGELPPQVDPRQMSLFGAGWTAGSIKYLAQGGASSLTYYETTGWRGVMETATGSELPGRFHSSPGMLFPLYHVLADAGAFAGGSVLSSVSSDPLQVESLVLRDGTRTRLLLANMTAIPRDVCVHGLDTNAARVLYLDHESFDRATQDGEAFRREQGTDIFTVGGVLLLTLPPYAVARADINRADADVAREGEST